MRLTFDVRGDDLTLACKAASWFLAFIVRNPDFPRERTTYSFPGHDRRFSVAGDRGHVHVKELAWADGSQDC